MTPTETADLLRVLQDINAWKAETLRRAREWEAVIQGIVNAHEPKDTGTQETG